MTDAQSDDTEQLDTDVSKPKGGKDRPSGKDSESGGAGENGSEGGAGNGSSSSAGPSVFPTSSAVVEEPQPDAQKEGPLVPQYAEALEASIEGLGKNFRITLTYAADMPQQMPDKNTFMVVATAMVRNEDESYAFGARATQSGWEAYAGSKKQQSSDRPPKFPGTFEVSGSRIVMTIPWTYVGGAKRFQWFTNSTWFSRVANQAQYSYDPIPNQRKNKKSSASMAKYPN
jgi:hypothetical protein